MISLRMGRSSSKSATSEPLMHWGTMRYGSFLREWSGKKIQLLLEISRKSLHKEGILGDDLDIECVFFTTYRFKFIFIKSFLDSSLKMGVATRTKASQWQPTCIICRKWKHLSDRIAIVGVSRAIRLLCSIQKLMLSLEWPPFGICPSLDTWLHPVRLLINEHTRRSPEFPPGRDDLSSCYLLITDQLIFRSTNSIAEATCALLKHYRWNKVGGL